MGVVSYRLDGGPINEKADEVTFKAIVAVTNSQRTIDTVGRWVRRRDITAAYESLGGPNYTICYDECGKVVGHALARLESAGKVERNRTPGAPRGLWRVVN